MTSATGAFYPYIIKPGICFNITSCSVFMASLVEIKEPFHGLKNYNAKNLFIATNWLPKKTKTKNRYLSNIGRDTLIMHDILHSFREIVRKQKDIPETVIIR